MAAARFMVPMRVRLGTKELPMNHPSQKGPINRVSQVEFFSDLEIKQHIPLPASGRRSEADQLRAAADTPDTGYG
ncbi:MAG TPA: hypothetical protein DCE44_05725 [Verrucomicrobiales bacterium]|nr:hypothetical protein [Verrucomicrobiales bacterium]